MIKKSKNKKVLIGIIAAIILLLGLIFGGITLAGNSPARRADKYLDLGNKYLNELDYEQALVAYRQVLEIEPKNLDAYKGALQASEGLGDRDGMAEFYTAALGMIESMTEQELKSVYDTAVEIYLYADAVYSEDYEAVAQALERGYDTLGGDERLIRELIKEYGILAGAYIDAGDYEKEQEIYRKILEKGLENAGALSGWEQRIRERFQEYLSKNGGSGNAPGTPTEPMPESTPEPTPAPTPEPTPEPIVLQGNVKDSGEYKGLSWQVTDAGELAVTGHMEGEGFDSEDVWLEAPWRKYENETAVAYMSFTGAKRLSYLFGNEGNSVLVEVNLSGLDTSSVTDMGSMFHGCSSLSSVDVSGFDTSSVTSMFQMFYGCSSLSSVDVSGFDTSSVTDMGSMFFGCSSLSSVDVSGFDTSSVTSMFQMFVGCSSLSSVDVSGFDTSSVTSMRSMFDDCSSLSSLDLRSFDTSSVTNMSNMFGRCSNLGSLDLRSFDTSSVTNMSNMFGHCSSLSSVDVSGFDTSSVTDMGSMFSGCSSLSSLDLRSFDTSSVTNMSNMFGHCSSLGSLDLRSFDTSSVTNMNSMFWGCSSLSSVDSSSFDTSSVTSMRSMFSDCSNLQEILVGDGWQVPAQSDRMFNNCGVSDVTHK